MRQGIRRGLALALVVAAGCGGEASRPPTTTVSGKVVTGGPVSDAVVALYAVDPGSRRLTRLASGRTDGTGAYSITATVGTAPLLLLASGGTYHDDATGAVGSLSACAPATFDDARPGVLEALVGSDGLPRPCHLTPLTTIASRRVAVLSVTQGSAGLTEDSVRQVNEAVAQALNVGSEVTPVDPRALLPLDFASPSDAAAIRRSPLAPATLYGAALSGLSKQASTLGLPAPTTLVDALAADFTDGTFDGLAPVSNGANPSPVPLGSGNLSPTAAGADLSQATMSFLADTSRNASGATPALLGPQ